MRRSLIKINQLSHRYPLSQEARGPGFFALRHLDLEVQEGDVFGIIGSSGSGKTTLLRLLLALERPTEGRIEVAGEEISALSGEALRAARKKMGVVFQHLTLFSSRTVVENIMYPLEIEGVVERRARAEELIALVGLRGKEDRFPAQLSGGERQRVAIARALVHRPQLLLCDEATSALDPQTTRDILALLAELNRTMRVTLLLITHDMEVIKQICTRVAVLDHGEIVEQGTVEQLFVQPKHPVTERFLQHVMHELPDHLLVERKEGVLLRLSFTGASTKQPIISRLLREHEVEVNILLGGIDVLRKETVGNLVVELRGSPEERSRAYAFLQAQGVIYHELV